MLSRRNEFECGDNNGFKLGADRFRLICSDLTTLAMKLLLMIPDPTDKANTRAYRVGDVGGEGEDRGRNYESDGKPRTQHRRAGTDTGPGASTTDPATFEITTTDRKERRAYKVLSCKTSQGTRSP